MNLRRWILLGCMLSPRLGAALALSYYFGLAALLICLVIASLVCMDSL